MIACAEYSGLVRSMWNKSPSVRIRCLARARVELTKNRGVHARWRSTKLLTTAPEPPEPPWCNPVLDRAAVE